MRKTTRIVAILQGALAALTAGSLVLFAVLAATIGLQTPTGDVSSPIGRDRLRGGAITLEGGAQGGGDSGTPEETPSGPTVAAAPSAPPAAESSTGAPEPGARGSGPDTLNLSLAINITPPVSPNTRTIAGSTPLGSLGRVLNQLGIRVLFPSVGAGQSRFALGRLHLKEEHRAVVKLLRKRARHHRKADNRGVGGEAAGNERQGRSDNEQSDSHGSKSGKGSHSKKSGKSSQSETIGKHAGGGKGNKGGKHDKGGSKKEKSKDPDDESVSSGGGSKKEKSKKESDDDDNGRHGHDDDDDDDDDHHHHDDDHDDDDDHHDGD